MMHRDDQSTTSGCNNPSLKGVSKDTDFVRLLYVTMYGNSSHSIPVEMYIRQVQFITLSSL